MKRIYFYILFIGLFAIANLNCRTIHFSKDGKNNERKSEVFNYYYVEGIRLKWLGESSEALKNFEECVKSDPQNDAVYFQMAQILLNNGELIKGKSLLLKAYKLDKNNLWYNINLAKIYNVTSSCDSSVYFMERALELSKGNEEISWQLAEIYIGCKKFEKANSLYREIENKFELKKENGFLLAKGYLDCNDYKNAERILNELNNLYEKDLELDLMYAELYRKAGDNKKAKEKYEEIYVNDPDEPQVLFQYADFEADNGNIKEFTNIADKVINSNKIIIEDKILFLNEINRKTGFVKNNLNELEALLIEFEKKYLKYEDVLKIRINLYENINNKEKLKKRLIEIISEKPGYYYAWEKLLTLLSEESNYKELFKYAGQCSTEFNMYLLPKIYYASSAAEIGKYNIAREEIQKAKIIAGNQKEILIQVLSVEADINIKMKKFDDAFKVLDEILKIDADNKIILNNYAYYLAERGYQLDKAEKMILKVLSGNNENTTFLDTYAWILFKKGKTVKAEKIMKNIIYKTVSKDADYYEHYAYILKERKKYRKAIDFFEKAIREDIRKEYLKEEIISCTEKLKK